MSGMLSGGSAAAGDSAGSSGSSGGFASIFSSLFSSGSSSSSTTSAGTAASSSASSSSINYSQIAATASAVGGIFAQQQANKFETQTNINAANYNSQVAEYNAQIAENNASQATLSANQAAQQEREDTVRRISTIKNKFAKGGVVSSEGSSLLAQLDQAAEGQYSVDNTLYEGDLKSKAFSQEANLQRLKGNYNQSVASNARTAGSMKQGTSLLTGLSSIYKSVK